MNKQWILEHLEQAEAAIVNAMYKAAGPQGPVDGQYYPQMDHNTLDRIIVLHDELGRLKTSLKGKSHELCSI